jgi:hypothetical protein
MEYYEMVNYSLLIFTENGEDGVQIFYVISKHLLDLLPNKESYSKNPMIFNFFNLLFVLRILSDDAMHAPTLIYNQD